jgi:apolipoprotein N-acyltransferase
MSVIARPGWLGNLIALAAGASTPLAFAPFGFWPVLLLSLALFHNGLSNLRAGAALWRGWCYGFGLFLAGTSWVYVSIHDYGNAPAPLAALLTVSFVAGIAFFFGLFGWLWVRIFRRSASPLANALTFAALWIIQELFRGWFLTGFPWLYAGYSQLSAPLAGLVPIGGVWLPSFVIALTAALLSQIKVISTRRNQLAVALTLIALPWVGGQMLKGYAWTAPAGAPLNTLLVQGNVAQELKWNPEQLNAQLALYRDLTVEHIGNADLVVWPETAVPVLMDTADRYLADMKRFVDSHQATLITGVPVRQPNEQNEMRYYNGITVVGQGEGTYLKQKLVPFGEYVPLQDVLRGLIEFFDLPMSDFARGPTEQPPLFARSYRIAPFICYEVVYPEFAADLSAQSELLLTVSNDTWFGHSIGPLQHLQMAQMRALEAGRWMIRATNNGVTALINPNGEVTVELPQFRKGVLRGAVTPMQGETPYLKWRIWPLAALCAVLLVVAVFQRRRDRA